MRSSRLGNRIYGDVNEIPRALSGFYINPRSAGIFFVACDVLSNCNSKLIVVKFSSSINRLFR